MNSSPLSKDVTETRDARTQLRAGNRLFNGAMRTAMGAIFLLDEAGSTVIGIEVRSGTPVLQIDQPPVFVKGAVCVTRTLKGMRESVMVARFHGAQIEWIQRAASALRAGAVQ